MAVRLVGAGAGAGAGAGPPMVGGGGAGGRPAISVPPAGGAVMLGAMGAPAIGGSGDASIGPDGTASTGGASVIGAAAAPRTGGPPRRVEEHAPSARAEQITAVVSHSGFVILVLAYMGVHSDGFSRNLGYKEEYEPRPTLFRLRHMG